MLYGAIEFQEIKIVVKMQQNVFYKNKMFYLCWKILAVMGKNKWYTEYDGSPDAAFRPSGQQKPRKTSLPGMYTQSAREEVSFLVFWKSALKRLRRHFSALRFWIHRISFGAFQKKTLLKLSFIAGASYLIFGANSELSSFIGLGNTGTSINWEEETNLGVGQEKHKTKPTPKKEKQPVSAPRTDVAPVAVESIKGDQTAAYIRKFSGIAREEMLKYGVPASISLAQGLIESRAGTSLLARQNNNHFGMKCFLKNCPKGHCTNYSDDSHKDFFLNFKDPKLSWRAHSILISTGRYARLKKYGRDYKRWAIGLKSVGYATDGTYAQKLINTIERYQLYQFDK